MACRWVVELERGSGHRRLSKLQPESHWCDPWRRSRDATKRCSLQTSPTDQRDFVIPAGSRPACHGGGMLSARSSGKRLDRYYRVKMVKWRTVRESKEPTALAKQPGFSSATSARTARSQIVSGEYVTCPLAVQLPTCDVFRMSSIAIACVQQTNIESLNKTIYIFMNKNPN